MEGQTKAIEGLKPYDKQLYLMYRCPKCQGEWRMTLDEVRLVGRQMCYCGRLLIFASISDVRILIKHSNDNYQKLIDTPPPASYTSPRLTDTLLYDESVRALTGLGYKEKDAKYLTSKAIQSNLSTVEDIIRSVFTSSKT